ncbi:hypothetical protein, partial [Nocardioides sp. SYSU DS0663]|uniref:hypothetical protein n=1 Tax=Nocardioides sp. SYSU DS0663 TaxID=3416445 RepID=UPI003F4C20A4
RPEAREQRRALERAAGRAVDLADDARRAARVLGPVGTAVDVVVAADKIRDGASPSETVVSTAAGVAGAVGAAALVSAGAPIVVPALAAGAGAVVASETAGFVWRRLPDGFTEEVDEAAADAWHAGKRFLEDGLDRLVPG